MLVSRHPVAVLSLLLLSFALLAAGCSESKKKKEAKAEAYFGEVEIEKLIEEAKLDVVAREEYLVAEQRLKKVKIGDTREQFFVKMGVVASAEDYAKGNIGEFVGLLSELNTRADLSGMDSAWETFSFGYYLGSFVVEKTAVIMRSGKVDKILDMLSLVPDDILFVRLNDEIFLPQTDRGRENELIQRHMMHYHWTEDALKRAEENLKKVEPGMTSAEMRHFMGGYFHVIKGSLVYFQDGFLFGPGFRVLSSRDQEIKILPIGYVDPENKQHKKYEIKAINGLIAEINELK